MEKEFVRFLGQLPRQIEVPRAIAQGSHVFSQLWWEDRPWLSELSGFALFCTVLLMPVGLLVSGCPPVTFLFMVMDYFSWTELSINDPPF